MRSKLLLLLAVSAVVMFSPPVHAGIAGTDVNVTAKYGTEALSGFTQYELKFTMYQEDQLLIYGHSRLRFPFTTYFTGGIIGAEYQGFDANFGYWSDYSYDKSLIMEDFDWLTSTTNDFTQLAIGYTMPHPKMHYFHFDVGYNFRIKNLGVRPFFEYTKYHSEFTMDDLTQFWYYNTETGEPIDPPQELFVSGEVLYYEQDLQLPMVGSNFNFSLLNGKLEMFSNLGFSFFSHVKDFDDHLVRDDSLTAENSGSGGSAYLMELGAGFNIFQGLWINAKAGYRQYNIDT
jgi:hypothetical protein